MELNGAVLNMNPAIVRSVEAMFPTLYQRETRWGVAGSSVAADRRTVSIPKGMTAAVGSLVIYYPPQSLDLNVAASWDSVATDYTVAANRAGKDFCLYATVTGKIVLSANATVPTGYTAGQVRKIGGLHCECLAVGTIAGHPLTGYLAGDIVPASVWDLSHRSPGLQAGMAYVDPLDEWWMIYLQSGTGTTTVSAFGGTITDTRIWNDHADDMAAVGLVLPSDIGFQVAAEGSNQKTNITGSADPATTGGHIDTAGRRMISNYGLEDCCGVMWQWLADQSYRNDDASYLGTWSYYALPGNKGSIYRQGGAGDVKLLAGGTWYNGTSCGSRSRSAYYYRWYAVTSLGARGCARRHAGVS